MTLIIRKNQALVAQPVIVPTQEDQGSEPAWAIIPKYCKNK
jgi:hypothetical protein